MAPFGPFGVPIGLGARTLTFDARAEGGFVGVKCFEKLRIKKFNHKTQVYINELLHYNMTCVSMKKKTLISFN
jgi:hypothetical protein